MLAQARFKKGGARHGLGLGRASGLVGAGRVGVWYFPLGVFIALEVSLASAAEAGRAYVGFY